MKENDTALNVNRERNVILVEMMPLTNSFKCFMKAILFDFVVY